MQTKKIIVSLLALAIVLVLGSGCRHIRLVHFNIMQPAQITFPSDVKTLLIVDRTRFEKQKKAGIIEGVITGELPGEDRSGEETLITALHQTLSNSPRFEVKRASEILEGNSLTTAFPTLIPWDTIDYLCKKYNTDVVVALEIFDTDFIITNGQRVKKTDATATQTKPEYEYFAQGVGRTKVGLRVYDPKGRTIVDQQLYTTANTWSASGNNIAEALLHLISKTEATRYLSQQAAQEYAYKITPYSIRITREFYSRGRLNQIATGRRMADVNDWTSAIKTWESALPYAKRKDAGRICLNIAVAYEVLGDLENAKKWVSKAYVEYNNKRAGDYSMALDYRIRNEQRLNQQME